jgi:putative Mn2+ efflux pump MntP
MTQVLAFLKEVWPYAAIAILVFIGRHFLERRIKAGVDSRFAKRLEDHNLRGHCDFYGL